MAQLLGEDTKEWRPVPPTWLVLGEPPHFTVFARKTVSSGEVPLTPVENVYIKLDLDTMIFYYRTIPFHRRLKPKLSVGQLKTRTYNDVHNIHQAVGEQTILVVQDTKDRKEVRMQLFEPI